MYAITQGLAFLTIAGLMLNEVLGSPLLMLATAGWLVMSLAYGKHAADAIIRSGPLVWLVPVVALASAFWSQEPALTIRAGVETLLTTALMAYVARYVQPRNFILILFAVLALIAAFSVPIDKLSLDGMTGAINRTGIFENKNSFSDCSAMLIMTGLIILTDSRLAARMRLMTIPFIGLGMVQNLRSHAVATTTALALSIAWGGAIFIMTLLPAKARKVYVTFVVVGGVCLIGLGALIAVTFQSELLELVGKDPTLTGRTELWFYASRFIASHSSWGVGYNAFWVRGYPLAEFLWHLEHVEPGSGFHFHDLYYEVAVELGLPGVVSGALVILSTFFYTFQWLRSETSRESMFFFSFVVFILIIQVQGYNLFVTFDPWYAIFTATLLYSHNWHKWRVMNTRVVRRAPTLISGAPNRKAA